MYEIICVVAYRRSMKMKDQQTMTNNGMKTFILSLFCRKTNEYLENILEFDGLYFKINSINTLLLNE